MNLIIIIVPILAVVALLFAVLMANSVKKEEVGTDKMKEISEAIREGAGAFLTSEYKILVIFVAVLFGKLFSFTENVLIALSVKSATSPIALELARQLEGDATLAASIAVACGILGAMLGPVLLTWIRMDDPFTRGLTLGTISHGIGTAQAATEHPLSGATGGAAMGLTAIFTSFILPILYPFLF